MPPSLKIVLTTYRLLKMRMWSVKKIEDWMMTGPKMFFRLFKDILVQMFDSVRQGQNKTPAFCDTLEGVAFWPCLTQSLNIEYLLFGHMEPKCIFFWIPEKTNALVQSVGTEMDWFNRWPLFYTRHLTWNGHIPTLKRLD